MILIYHHLVYYVNISKIRILYLLVLNVILISKLFVILFTDKNMLQYCIFIQTLSLMLFYIFPNFLKIVDYI